MARNRMIKPEFWASEQILNCSAMARLAFIGLWNFADDNGVHPASFKTLKAEVFPADDISIDAIKGFVNELIQQNLLREYAIDDKSFWLVTGWKTHQKIEKPRYRYPLPQSNLRLLPLVDEEQKVQQLFNEDSIRSHLPVADRSPITPGSIDSENKIREKKIKTLCGVETPPTLVVSSLSDPCTKIFEYWQIVMNHPRAKLDRKRRKAIEQALKLSFSIEDLKIAVDGCRNTPFNMGQNERKEKYDDIGLIFRDAAHIERFMNNAKGHDDGCESISSSDLMAGVL